MTSVTTLLPYLLVAGYGVLLARSGVGYEETPDERGRLTVPLSPEQMKITHSAVKLLLNDLQRGQAAEREILRAILAKLPDEHTMRAIELH